MCLYLVSKVIFVSDPITENESPPRRLIIQYWAQARLADLRALCVISF